MAKRLLALVVACVALGLQAGAQTYTLSPMPRVPFTDTANGNVPLAAGKICTYVAGTSTPVFTFLDASGTQNANPVRTDGNGMATIYLAAGSSYKFVVLSCANGVCGDTTCNTGTVLYTQDNISAVPSGAANVDQPGTAGEALTAGQVAYVSDGSGGKQATRWYKADATNPYSSTTPGIGIALAALSAGQVGTFRTAGAVSGLSGLSGGADYYVSPTPGSLTTTVPVNTRLAGRADSTTSLILYGNPPLRALVAADLGTFGVTVLDRQVTTQTVGPSSTTETSVYSFSVPGGTLSTNRTIRVTYTGDFINNSGGANGYTLRVKYGGTTFLTDTNSDGTSANRGSTQFTAYIHANNATNAQTARGDFLDGTGTANNATGTTSTVIGVASAVNSGLAIDSTAAQTLTITLQLSASNANLSARTFSVVVELL